MQVRRYTAAVALALALALAVVFIAASFLARPTLSSPNSTPAGSLQQPTRLAAAQADKAAAPGDSSVPLPSTSTATVEAPPASISPTEILARVVQAAHDPRAFGLNTYHGLTISPSGSDQFPAQTWFQAPAQERVQASNGETFLSDGESAWMFEQGRVTLVDTNSWGGPAAGFLQIPFPLQDAAATFVGKDQVAGRSTYIMDLRAGPSAPPPSPKGSQYRQARVWYDRRFYIPLKIELMNAGGQPGMSWAFTSFEANPALDPALFAFVLPQGDSVLYESRPNEATEQTIWQGLAGQLPYAVFRPADLPAWLTYTDGPEVGGIYGNWLNHEYMTKDPAADPLGMVSSMNLIELAQPTGAAQLPPTGLPGGGMRPVQVGPYSGRYGEEYSSKWLVVDREGTEVWLEGMGRATEADLVAMALSLQRVPPAPALTPVAVATLPLPLATAQALATTSAIAANQHFGEGDLEFVDNLHGFYLPDRCPGNAEGDCTRQFLATENGGQLWRVVGSAPPDVSHIRFAGASDGWAYGPRLYVTHDGGASWTESTGIEAGDPNSEVTGLEWLGGNVCALMQSCLPDPAHLSITCTVSLRISADKGTTWQTATGLPPGHEPGGLIGRMSLSPNSPTAQNGWLMAVGGLLVTHDGGHTWQAHASLPCPAEYEWRPLLASDGGTGFYLVCGDQPGAGNQPKSVYRSKDEGAHWQFVADSGHGRPGGIQGSGYLNSLAAASPQQAWLSLQRGTLYGTSDGGANWTVAVPMPGDGSTGEVLFSDPQHGWWLTLGELYRTTDGGARWDKLPHP